MQENEFEKKLQQKIEGLQLQPTGDVWEKVKAQVAQKKRKRRFAFLFLAVSTLLAGLFIADSLSLINTKQEMTVAKSEPTVLPVEKRQGYIPANSSDENTVAAIAPRQETNSKSNEEKNKSVQKIQPVTVRMSSKKFSAINISEPVVNAANETKHQPVVKRKTKATTKTTVINAQPVAEEVEESITVSIPQSLQSDKGDSEMPGNAKAETKNSIPATMVTPPEEKKLRLPEAANSIANEKQDKKTKKQKWGLGLSFSGGLTSAGYNNMNKSLAYEDFLGAIPGNIPTANGGSYYPSDAKKAFGFSAGIELYRYLSGSVKLTGGLQYQLYSTSQKTGQQEGLQAFSDTRYAYGNSISHTNKYHYLSIPLGVSAPVFNIGSRGISVSAGINFSRLLQANALAFDTTNGYYYQNKAAFNKTLIGLSASLSINLAAKNKPALYIGPQFYYNITPLANTGIYAGTHSSFVGIKLQKNLTH